jgi:hypothetical protein
LIGTTWVSFCSCSTSLREGLGVDSFLNDGKCVTKADSSTRWYPPKPKWEARQLDCSAIATALEANKVCAEPVPEGNGEPDESRRGCKRLIAEQFKGASWEGVCGCAETIKTALSIAEFIFDEECATSGTSVAPWPMQDLQCDAVLTAFADNKSCLNKGKADRTCMKLFKEQFGKTYWKEVCRCEDTIVADSEIDEYAFSGACEDKKDSFKPFVPETKKRSGGRGGPQFGGGGGKDGPQRGGGASGGRSSGAIGGFDQGGQVQEGFKSSVQNSNNGGGVQTQGNGRGNGNRQQGGGGGNNRG